MCASKITQASAPRSSSRDPVDDRVAADLLLAVAGDAHVHRQRALGGEQRRRLQQQVELPLVVGDPARVEPLVADRRLERRALPQRRAARAAGRRSARRRARSARRRRPARRASRRSRAAARCALDELALAARGANEVAHPLGRAHDVLLVRGSALTLGMRSNSESSSSQAGRSARAESDASDLADRPQSISGIAQPRPTWRPRLTCDDASAVREGPRGNRLFPPWSERERAARRRRGASGSRPARAASSGSGSRSAGCARG